MRRIAQVILRTTLGVAIGIAVSLLAQSPFSYRITHTYPLGGDGSWDYIVPDPPNPGFGRQSQTS